MAASASELRQQARVEVHKHARAHLFDYMQLIHPEVEPGGKFLEVRHSMALARAFERVATGETKRLLVAIPPRFGKSFVGSIALPTWLLGRDPSLKIICASYADELARDFAGKSRAAMMSPIYRQLFPATRFAADGGAIHRLITTRGGYRQSTSVEGAVTGKGADLIIVDDPLKAKDAVYSQAARDTAYNWIKGSLMSRFDEPANGRMIVISQRLHTDDLVARLRDDGGWELLSVPAEALTDTLLDIGTGTPWHLKPGDCLYPEKFDKAALDLLRHDLGEAAYAAQILQDPRALGGNIFKLKDFVPGPEAFNPAKMEAIYQSWDTAISEEESAAWSVCTTWGVRGKWLALIDVFRKRLSYPALLKAVHEQYAKYKPRVVLIERASSGIALLQQLKIDGHAWARSMRPEGSKIERAMHQLPKIEQGRVTLPTKAPWLETFKGEVAEFPMGRSDQVDSMTQFLYAFDAGRYDLAFRNLSYWQDRL